jgi:uncharacterized membrane protein YhhN
LSTIAQAGGHVPSFFILLAAIPLLTGLLLAEKHVARERILTFKAPLSLLFVVYAWVQPHDLSSYFILILIGLVLGAIGDVLLALDGPGTFRAGLIAFLAGHVMYVVAFQTACAPRDWLSPVIAIPFVASTIVFFWLRPHAGRLIVPMICYVVVITVMVVGALGVFASPKVDLLAAGVVLTGAVMFYLSDITVARHRFVQAEFGNRLLGLPLYYIAQFMIAYSVGLLA